MFRVMKIGMFATTNYFKIFNSIVFNIVVFVVNNFIKIKFSSKMFFHYISMFSEIRFFSSTPFFWCNPNKNIPKIIDFFSTIPPTVKFSIRSTFYRTKFHSSATTSVESFNCCTAINAWWSWYKFRHKYTIDVEGLIVNV